MLWVYFRPLLRFLVPRWEASRHPRRVRGTQAAPGPEVAPRCRCLGAPAAAGKEPVCGADASRQRVRAPFSSWPQRALGVLPGAESGIAPDPELRTLCLCTGG